MTVCGLTWQQGLSPRMRGNHLRIGADRPRCGSIPAYAGEPSTIPARFRITMVYPRVCGGTACSSANILRSAGLSPRMRGNPV